MNFQGKAALVYLQEDNIVRAYFRIRPLLTEEGLVRPEDWAAFPDEGYLRIVPDKNEQHTFKERMRSLCGLCLMDLRDMPPEANKIRTNKNYYPAHGEVNQFIIYSDAVRALPDQLLYQVVSEENIAKAHTPCVYLRKGANIQGPFRKDTAQPEGETAPLAPDSEGLFAVTVDGQELLFYWPKKQIDPQGEKAAETPVDQPTEPPAADSPAADAISRIQELNAAVNEDIKRIKSESADPGDFVPQEVSKPLVGTRLYQAPCRSSLPRRAHNPLMETVEHQRYAAKYEAPGAVIAPTAVLKEVPNPVDAFKRALQGVCQTPETQKQAAEVMVHQPGMRPILSKALYADHQNDYTLSAMQTQLQELEAERLMALMQLDDVKKSLSDAKAETLNPPTAEEEKKLAALKAAQETEQAALEALRAALAETEQQRSLAAETIRKAEGMEGRGVLLPVTGEDCDREALLRRVTQCFEAAGFAISRDDALQLMLLLSQAEGRLELTADTKADAQAAAFTLAHALGAPIVRAGCTGIAGEPIRPRILPGGDTPVFIVDAEDCLGAVNGAVTISLSRDAAADSFIPEDYAASPFAFMQFTAQTEAAPVALPPCGPVRMESVRKAVLSESPLSQDAQNALIALRRAIRESGVALPLTVVKKMTAFVAAGQSGFRGGVAEAIDRAALCYAVPHIRAYGLETEGILAAAAALPRTVKKLRENTAL